jgi:flagellar protein FlbT
MPLKVELKPNERIIVGTAVIRNADVRTRFFIEGDAPILREKDILTADSANSPARKIYLAVQLMYLQGDLSSHHRIYFPLVKDFIAAAPSSLPLIAEINNCILSGDLYKALKVAKKLIAYEEELIGDATGGERVREGGAGHAVPSGTGSDHPDEGGDETPVSA